MYTIGSDQATSVITSSPWAEQTRSSHLRAGINLASWAIDALRHPGAIHRARSSQYPRVAALLDTLGDAPAETSDPSGDWYFILPAPDGTGRRQRLDQIAITP